MADTNLSFIPKKTFTQSAFYQKRGFGLFGSLSFLIFFVAMVVCGGLYVYKTNLTDEAGKLSEEVISEKRAIEPETISELIKISNQIAILKDKIKERKVASPIFKIISDTTLKDVYYGSFRYELVSDIPKVILSGATRSYGVLAAQIDAFNKSGGVGKITLSDVGAGEKGQVKFTIDLEMLPSTVLAGKK